MGVLGRKPMDRILIYLLVRENRFLKYCRVGSRLFITLKREGREKGKEGDSGLLSPQYGTFTFLFHRGLVRTQGDLRKHD